MSTPVRYLPNETPDTSPAEGIGLCFSGGGYRAMLFHLGSLWRINQAGLLTSLTRISSVSGGSITSAALGLAWSQLDFGENGVARNFEIEVVAPVRKLAARTIDKGSIIGGILLPGSVADMVVKAYRKYIFGDATLQDLPTEPRFVFNATSVQTGALWRFSKPYMADYKVGLIRNPEVALATAVAASSAFPPVLSPLSMDVEPEDFAPEGRGELFRHPFNTDLVLSDGGVYDNLGLETVWKKFRTVLVSDGGGQMQPQGEPKSNWAQHGLRVIDLIDNQVRSLRKRQLIDSYILGKNEPDNPRGRQGAFWGIRSDIRNYGVDPHLPCSLQHCTELAELKTRLKAMSPRLQERLINWGYAVTDTALRRHYDPAIPAAHDFPYGGGVAP